MPTIDLRSLYRLTCELHWSGTRGEASSTGNAEDVLSILGSTTRASSVTPRVVQGLIRSLKAKGNTAATVNRKLAALSRMLSVAEEAGEIAQRPRIPRLKEAQHRTRFLTLKEEHDLLERLDPDCKDLCLWLVETGMRVGEALRLRWSDINNKAASIRSTKADLPRTIPLTEVAWEAIHRRMGLPQGPFAEPGLRVKLSRSWNEAKAAIGLGDDAEVVPHILRHTCASRMVQNGIGILMVQKWLGHRSLSQTMRYAHLAVDQLEQARAALDGVRIGKA
jgi:integrase